MSAGRGTGTVSGYSQAGDLIGTFIAVGGLTLLIAPDSFLGFKVGGPDEIRAVLGPVGGWVKTTSAAVDSNTFLPTAAFYLLFALPAFFFVADVAVRAPQRARLGEAYRSVFATLRGLRAYAGVGILKDLPEPPPDAWAEITLRQRLNHTSGLPDYFGDPDLQKAFLASLDKAPPPEKLFTYAYDHDPPLLFDPGSKYQYSNSDNIAVALMVEAATGTSYEDQLRERVYKPLGLKKTSLPRGTDLKKPFIHGYDNDPSQDPPDDISEVLAAGWAWASGGIVSTPADLNAFIRGYVGGELFDERTRAKQRRVIEGGSSEPPGPGKNSAGLAIFRYQTRCGTVWGHTGNFFGYTQFAAASADGRRSVTVSINAQHTPTTGSLAVFEALRRAEAKAVCAALAD